MHAVIHRVEYPKPPLVDGPPPAPIPKSKKTYAQDWPNYNRAQTQEKDVFMRMLKGLTDNMEDEQAQGPGRPRTPLRDLTFAVIFKVYSRLSARRFSSEIDTAHRSGLISHKPQFNSVLNAMNDPRMTELLLNFIAITSGLQGL